MGVHAGAVHQAKAKALTTAQVMRGVWRRDLPRPRHVLYLYTCCARRREVFDFSLIMISSAGVALVVSTRRVHVVSSFDRFSEFNRNRSLRLAYP